MNAICFLHDIADHEKQNSTTEYDLVVVEILAMNCKSTEAVSSPNIRKN
jgi:hypothetical protein